MDEDGSWPRALPRLKRGRLRVPLPGPGGTNNYLKGPQTLLVEGTFGDHARLPRRIEGRLQLD